MVCKIDLVVTFFGFGAHYAKYEGVESPFANNN